MLDALWTLGRALVRIIGDGEQLPGPFSKAVDGVNRVRGKLENPRVRRFIEIGAEAADQVAEEMERNREANPSNAYP